MSEQNEDLYPCVGVCMSDPETGVCMGCGRPPLGGPDVSVELIAFSREARKTQGDPDTPE
ncbi:MAG: hypothetical protein RLZZ300_315 [Pseudomonadota bacterium]